MKKKQILLVLLSLIMLYLSFSGNIEKKAVMVKEVKAESVSTLTLENHKKDTDETMNAGQKVTYDCVWFGSYPQTEIVNTPGTCGCYGKDWGQESDYEVDSSLYSDLKNTDGWVDNDKWISDQKYHRIKSSDASYIPSSDPYGRYYKWSSSTAYHYFRYEPIKWRVLRNTNGKVLLLADQALDAQEYNTTDIDITWKDSTIRSWLNGYAGSENVCSEDYSEKNFINMAFRPEEESLIQPEFLHNDNTGTNTAQYGGENTTDKIFLLSSYDLYCDENGPQRSVTYGFVKAQTVADEARRSNSSTYAKAMGIMSNFLSDSLGMCAWNLRSPGNKANKSVIVSSDGKVDVAGKSVTYAYYGVRPSLYIDLSSSGIDEYVKYAGKVYSDGTMHEENDENIVDTYRIKYFANSGRDIPANQFKTMGKSITLSTTVPTRTGYSFAGWALEKTSTEISYQPGDVYDKDENLVLYAVWKPTITLTYDANGGNGEPASQTEIQEEEEEDIRFTISSKEPIRDNYNFLGWSMNSNASSATFNAGNTISLRSDTTLYAVWQEVPSTGYIVSYNANGGEGAPSFQTKTAGEPLILDNYEPNRNGYEFVGWGTNKATHDISYKPGGKYDNDANLILYAIWEKSIKLSYYAEEGINVPSEDKQKIYNNESECTFKISDMMLSRSGYDFLGWSMEVGATSVSYPRGGSITVSSDTTLFAVWSKKEESGEESGEDETVISKPVVKRTQTITALGKKVPINNAPFNLGAKSNINGILTYKSSNTKVATIDSSGMVTIKGYGVTNITITASETSAYKKEIKSVPITVVPKRMKIKSVKSPKKGQLQIKWKKDKAATSYQVQFSRDWKFNAKKSKVYEKKLSSKLITLKKPVTGLTSKKKYYVRIRADKKINGKKLQGIWSATKEIKIK